MMHQLRAWWPAFPALILVVLGSVSFVENYPRAIAPKSASIQGSQQPDSLLALVRLGQARQSAESGRDSTATVEVINPFRSIRPIRTTVVKTTIRKVQPPPRRYVLKGTVGTRVATIANNVGQKQIVKVGDTIDSAQVISIEANKVKLKDRAGQFELLIEK